jgi:hypothetical protein
MSDQIANFALRNGSTDELGIALGRCYAEFNAWHGQADFTANFANDARFAGVHSVITERMRKSLCLMKELGILTLPAAHEEDCSKLASELADHQLVAADVGVKVAAIVMLHNACERFIWRLIRFGFVAKRPEVQRRIENRKVAIKVVADKEAEVVIDEQIEKWWNELERQSLIEKWDCLVDLVGFPKELCEAEWHFDKKMLSGFDTVRHTAVHHDAQAVRDFDFSEFARQLSRAQMVWFIHIAQLLKVQIPADVLFSAKTE